VLFLPLQKKLIMKKFLLILFVLINILAVAQVKKKVATTPAQPVLKTAIDSLSYALGMSAGNFYKQQGMLSLNTPLCSKGMNDALKSGKTLLNEQQANSIIMAFMQKESAEKAADNKKAGAAFLAANKNKPGVITLPSGMQYMVLQEGTGPKPVATDKVKCHYEGSLIDGTVFESSIKNGQPVVFSVNGVIAGWTEALQLMPVGSKWRLFIPSNLAYGDQGNQGIKPGATLIFDVQLLEIVK
jgi:FKBP-type peptidyl-prolyl cis-trans isomerase FklB